jgi:hypothetical protein
MSSYSKGKSFEKKVADNMRGLGYEIFFKSQFIRFGSIDFAGMWDLVGAKRITATEVAWVFIQCKSRKLYGKDKEPLSIWKAKYALPGMNCIIALKKKIKNRVAIEFLAV